MRHRGRPQTPTAREELLRRAVLCYRRAGADDDACRCLQQLGDFAAAALLHEQAKRWLLAARCFEGAAQWRSAARCYLVAHEPESAACCLIAAEDYLEAGWLLAHEAQRVDRARAVLARVQPQGDEETLALALAVARCHSVRQPGAGGSVLRRVVTALPQLAAGPGRERVVRWALAQAEVLRRPDLAAQLHAAMLEAGLPQAVEHWETWAQQRLGSAQGIPVEAVARSSIQVEP